VSNNAHNESAVLNTSQPIGNESLHERSLIINQSVMNKNQNNAYHQ